MAHGQVQLAGVDRLVECHPKSVECHLSPSNEAHGETVSEPSPVVDNHGLQSDLSVFRVTSKRLQHFNHKEFSKSVLCAERRVWQLRYLQVPEVHAEEKLGLRHECLRTVDGP